MYKYVERGFLENMMPRRRTRRTLPEIMSKEAKASMTLVFLIWPSLTLSPFTLFVYTLLLARSSWWALSSYAGCLSLSGCRLLQSWSVPFLVAQSNHDWSDILFIRSCQLRNSSTSIFSGSDVSLHHESCFELMIMYISNQHKTLPKALQTQLLSASAKSIIRKITQPLIEPHNLFHITHLMVTKTGNQ